MKRSSFGVVCAAASCLVSGLAFADDTVLPQGYTNTGGGLTFLGPLSTSQRTYQWLISADQLTGLVGHNLTGMAFRNSGGSTTAWPPADASIANFDLRIGEGVAPASRSLTDITTNIVGPQTLVRSGPLNIPAGSYPVTVAPHPFGPTITFTQPYPYSGGNLLIELRMTGVTGATSRAVDAVGTSAATGYGTQFSAAWIGNYTATTGAVQGNFVVFRLTSVPGGSTACNRADLTDIGDTGAGPDGQLTVDDIIAFVNTFGDATGCPGIAPCNRADITDIGDTGAGPDGELTVDDIIAFVNAFGDGC